MTDNTRTTITCVGDRIGACSTRMSGSWYYSPEVSTCTVSAVSAAGCAAAAGSAPSTRGSSTAIAAAEYHTPSRSSTSRRLTACARFIDSAICHIAGTSGQNDNGAVGMLYPTVAAPTSVGAAAALVSAASGTDVDSQNLTRSYGIIVRFDVGAAAAASAASNRRARKSRANGTATASTANGDNIDGVNSSRDGPSIGRSVRTCLGVFICCERLRLCGELVHKQTQRQNCCQKQRA